MPLVVVALGQALTSSHSWWATATLIASPVFIAAIAIAATLAMFTPLMIERLKRLRRRPTAKVWWSVAGATYAISLASLAAGNVLAAHQSVHWWHAVIYADLGGIGSFISALIAIVALRVSRSQNHSATGESKHTGMTETERRFMSELMRHMTENKLSPLQVDQISHIAMTLVEPKRDVKITNVYHEIEGATEGVSQNGAHPPVVHPTVAALPHEPVIESSVPRPLEESD